MAAILKTGSHLEFWVARRFFQKSNVERVFMPNLMLVSTFERFLWNMQLSAPLDPKSDKTFLANMAGMVHSVSGWMRGVQVKLWDPLRTRAIPECLRGVFTTRRYTNTRLPYLTLPILVLSAYSTMHGLLSDNNCMLGRKKVITLCQGLKYNFQGGGTVQLSGPPPSLFPGPVHFLGPCFN